jgi:4-hydroxybenzoate polyprenyltransferase
VSHDLIPLCVDLDGTLLKTDTLHELIVRLVKREPWQLLILPWIIFQCIRRGKQHLKEYLAERVQLSPGLLPRNEQFYAYLKQEHGRGRKLVLVTGCHEKVASAIADETGLFNDVIATNHEANLTGACKSKRLVALYGEKGFDYAGNGLVDNIVWKNARQCILVNATPALKKRLSKGLVFQQVFDQRVFLPAQWMRGLRLHQWAKNALIFLPAMTAHVLWQPGVLTLLFIAFIAFGCCASFSYVINDLLDLDDDRAHHRKKYRPFASGDISIPVALFLAAALLLGAVFLAIDLSWRFAGWLALYLVATNLYSFKLKKIPILDVAVLAGLYTLRVFAGAVVVGVQPTFWLIAFSAFLFFSLAIVKRLSELLYLQKQGDAEVKARGYIAADIITLQGLGSASALAAVMVLALYINSDSVRLLYHSPNQLWLLCPVLLLWLGRVWLVTGRGNMHDDPVVFALKDRTSWVILLLAVAVLISATYF